MSAIAVVLAGGGTGGHLFPAIAVARELLARQPDARVTFAGTARGLETTLVPREGFELDLIRSAGLKGKSPMARLRGAGLVPLGLVDAWRILSRRKPNVVVGVGGYSSGPVVLAAALRGIPTMVLEQNAVPGLTNRWLAPWVRAAAVTYEESLPHFRGKGFVSGNPVRPEFVAVARTPQPAPSDRLRLLVLGGSQGAHVVNVATAAGAADLLRQHPSLDLVHQTGERDLSPMRDAYARAGVTARVEPFLHDVAKEMLAASVVMCRAGATTLAEVAAVARPAVLVPFAAAADDHQRKNAEALAAGGAAVVVEEKELSGARVAREVGALLEDAPRRQAMAVAMQRFARPDAARVIVDRLLALVHG